jgi:hypothetical protein
MYTAFEIVIVAVCGLGLVAGLFAAATNGKLWQDFQDRAMTRDRTDPLPNERELEIRQLVEARNARRVRRGEAVENVEAEVSRLVAEAAFAEAAADPELLAEMREMVHARNARRERRGEPPLDVESEIARMLASGGGEG